MPLRHIMVSLTLLLAFAGGWAMASHPTGSPVTAQPLPTPTGRIIAQLTTGRDYDGPVQRAAIDATGNLAYLATLATLYEVRNGQAQPIARRPQEAARLEMAPGGQVYAWLIPGATAQGVYDIQLMAVPDRRLTDLRLPDFPFGFGTLYLGFEGNLIVTASPLEDWHGFHGRVKYTFWNQQGTILKQIELPALQEVALDPRGQAILFLGEAEAVAFTAAGDELWRLPGHFRRGAIANGGHSALLNPALPGPINTVTTFDDTGRSAVIQVATPVHGVLLSPDGSQAVAIGDAGRYFVIDRATGTATEAPALPLSGTFYTFDADFVDDHTVAFGVLYRQGTPGAWPLGTIVAVRQDGTVAFRIDFPIRQATAGQPAIDITFGHRTLVGYTMDTTVLAEVESTMLVQSGH